jgi:hypothetical protein
MDKLNDDEVFARVVNSITDNNDDAEYIGFVEEGLVETIEKRVTCFPSSYAECKNTPVIYTTGKQMMDWEREAKETFFNLVKKCGYEVREISDADLKELEKENEI